MRLSCAAARLRHALNALQIRVTDDGSRVASSPSRQCLNSVGVNIPTGLDRIEAGSSERGSAHWRARPRVL